MNMGISLFHSTTSIFSPCSSLTMFCMRTPRKPTHEPTGSTPSCRARTATLLREPGSLDIASISTAPLNISGTSISKRRLSSRLSARETISSGPLMVRSTDFSRTRILVLLR